MHVRRLGRSANGVRIWIGFEPSDVFTDRAREQFDILREVANMLTQIPSAPLIQRCAIETDFTAKWSPYANQESRQRRLT